MVLFLNQFKHFERLPDIKTKANFIKILTKISFISFYYLKQHKIKFTTDSRHLRTDE